MSDNADRMVDALSQLVLETAAAPSGARMLLVRCESCRNRLLYLLNTEPYTGGMAQALRARIRALPQDHELSHGNPNARDHGDSRRPQIRGLVP